MIDTSSPPTEPPEADAQDRFRARWSPAPEPDSENDTAADARLWAEVAAELAE